MAVRIRTGISLIVAGVAGLAFVVLTSGCAGMKTPSPSASSQSRPSQVETAAVPPAVPQPPVQSEPPPTVDAQPKAPANPVAPPGPPAQPLKKEPPSPVPAKPTAQSLDLTSLEQRLKDTKAIGVLTKITLKNQIDDLLDQFRAYYQGKLHTTLADLRRSYDLLFLKVLALLQDSDRSLATAIAASREGIWGILSDPAKFATI